MAETEHAGRDGTLLTGSHTEEERKSVVHKLYSYLNPWETRLLALQPGWLDIPLAASLHTAVLTCEPSGLGIVDEHRHVEYEALSYTWAGEILSEPLLCNGNVIGITHNLAMALRYLRFREKPRYLWIDALCINQVDNDEKARQIREIQRIFGRAFTVIAWIGEEAQTTASAFKALKALTARAAPEKFMRASSESREVYEGLADLAQRPWLSRVWVVQEVHAARAIVVQCSSLVITWKNFCKLERYLRRLRDTHNSTGA